MVEMSELDSPAVQAALKNEQRLTSIEGKVDQLLAVTTELRDRVGIQNGRITKAEQDHRAFAQQIRDKEELIEKPRWGRFESVASQMATIWQERASAAGMQAARHTFWQGVKARLDLMVVVIAILGGRDLIDLIEKATR